MSINTLIFAIFSVLAAIFFLFEPMEIAQEEERKEMALLELEYFTMYEFDDHTLLDILSAKKGYRYPNHYVLDNFIYTDKIDEDIITLSAKKGLYKDDILTLTKDVHYARSDGFEFKSQYALYNTLQKYVISDVPYVATQWDDVVVGDYLFYDLTTQWVYSKNVQAKYTIEETKEEK
jgi:hypothetical protein